MTSKTAYRVRRGVLSCALACPLLLNVTATSGAASGRAVVTGTLRVYGGVADAPPLGYPVAGRVVFAPTRGTAYGVKVGKSGAFTLMIRPGTYRAYGGPPGWHNDCLVNAGKPFKVRAGDRIKVVVACDAL